MKSRATMTALRISLNSIALGHDSPRVVLPPAHREPYTDAEIAQAMKDLRADVVRLTELMRQTNDLVRRMDLTR